MLEDFKGKIRLSKRVKALNLIGELRLIFHLLKFMFDKRNIQMGLIVDVDGIKYKLVDLESLFIISPRYEEWMWKHFTPQKGENFVDVGAHVGKYALQVARIVGDQGKVIAVEPHQENFNALLTGIRSNKLTNVLPFNVAAWDKECLLDLHVPIVDGKDTNAGLIGKGSSSCKKDLCTSTSTIQVPAIPLDTLVKEIHINHLDWIKIDVEGAEYEVLKGSERIICRYNPKIIVESTMDTMKTLEFMQKLGYTSLLIAENYFLFLPN